MARTVADIAHKLLEELSKGLEEHLNEYERKRAQYNMLYNLLHNNSGAHKNTFQSVTQQVNEGRQLVKTLRLSLDAGNFDKLYALIDEIDADFYEIQKLAESWNKTS